MDDSTYIPRVFLPKLRAAGVTEDQIETMPAANPQRVLSFAG